MSVAGQRFHETQTREISVEHKKRKFNVGYYLVCDYIAFSSIFNVNYFVYLHSSHCPCSVLPPTVPHPVLFPPVFKRMYLPPSIRPSNSLGSQVFLGLCASSLTESKPGSHLLYMCWGPHTSWCVLPGWWCSV